MNFVLVRPPLSLGRMALGFVYFVFLPSIATTPLAGKAVRASARGRPSGARLRVAGDRPAAAAVAASSGVLTGMVLVGVGTFFAQASATGFVGRAATTTAASASGIYLACYFFGGLVGSAVLGQLFDHLGWTACVKGVGASLALAAGLTVRLRA